jgi:hypothetical protein
MLNNKTAKLTKKGGNPVEKMKMRRREQSVSEKKIQNFNECNHLQVTAH